MKNRMLPALLCCLFILCGTLSPAPASAAQNQTFVFSDIYAQLALDTSVFDMVLTPDNLSQNTAWLSLQGKDPDAMANSFETEGIILEAYDLSESRTLVITANQDVDANNYFDLNTQDESMRRTYRQSHTNGSAYGLLGYTYSTATWRNYGKNADRFLRTKYVLKQNGEEVCKGYQRRTIRNGYTITLDLQVTGRALKSADEKLLEKVMSGFEFTQILDAPAGACKLTVSSDPPREVSSDTLTLSGSATAKATVTATLISLTTSTTKVFSDTASSKGKYELKITFPEQGTFSLMLTAQTEDGRTAQKSYTVMYQRNYLPLNLDAEVPYQLSGDTLVISGTTISGAKTQVSVSGPVTYQKTKTSKTFSFTIDTSKEGTYQIIVTASKKGLNTRTLTYTAVRTYTEEEKTRKTKEDALNVTYKKLVAGIKDYAGKVFAYTGYVLEVNQTGEEWTMKVALSMSGTTYKDIIYVISKTEPTFAPTDKVMLYGTLSANPYVEVVDGAGTSEFPRFELLIMEAAQ